MNFDQLNNHPRLLIEAQLRPVAGDRFQPTGFADLGAAEYKVPGGSTMLLVESAQSVANRLEKTCLDGDGPDIDPKLAGLPYIVAELEGSPTGPIRTSSLVEAHRLGSPYFLLNEELKSSLEKEMAYSAKSPLDWKKIYSTLFKYDPNSLIHGVFLSLLDGGRVRAPRAVTGFVEARDVERVISGGVKNSSVDPSGMLQVVNAKSSESGVYSNVPYSRVEYVAREIKAYFNLDLSLIRGYGLGTKATNLLIALSLLKVRRFLDGHLRLRTACDLELLGDPLATSPKGFQLPDEKVLLGAVKTGIEECAPQFRTPPITSLKTQVKLKDKEKAKKSGAS